MAIEFDPAPPPTPSDFARPGALLAGLGALLLALNELSNLSGQFLTSSGGHATLGQLGGPTALGYRAHWRDVLSQVGDWCCILVSYVILNLAFIAI
jgi:hypothetical protein